MIDSDQETDRPAHRDEMTDHEFELTFDPMFDLVQRWGITLDQAEAFLESVGYYEVHQV
jgi:hypothetical protein